MALPFPLPRVIAHRGESGLAPENTLCAFDLAAQNGATWVELDANISSDNVPFVHHDDRIDRCTNGEGLITQQTSQTLNSLDAGAWFDDAFKGEPLPSLAAVIELLSRHDMGLNLEIKPTAGLEQAATDAICAQIKQLWPERLPLLLSSFSEAALVRAAQQLPEIPRGYLVGGVPKDWRARMSELKCDTLHCSANRLTKADAATVKDAGVALLCYTVNDIDVAARLIEWGVDSVFTDYPSRLIPALSHA